MSKLVICEDRSDADKRKGLDDVIDSLVQLRPMSDIATQLLNVCQCDEPDLEKIIELIECDPSISMRTLNIANSPIIGATREIVSIPQAIVMLGFRRLSELAASLAASAIFSNGSDSKRYQSLIFEHSLGCATVARYIATANGNVDPSIAFLGGMLHDIGKLVLLDYAPEEYSRLLVDAADTTSIEREQNWVGTNHCDVGLHYGETWGLPSSIKAAIQYHHTNVETDLVKVVADANRICKLWGIGSPSPDSECEQEKSNPSEQELQTELQQRQKCENKDPDVSELYSETDRLKVTDEFESLKRMCCES